MSRDKDACNFADALNEIESLRQELEVLDKSHADLAHRVANYGTALRRITSLAPKNVRKYAQEIAREALGD